MDIIRTKTQVKGGITPEERNKLDDHAQKWIANAMQTGKTDRLALQKAIEDLYEVSGLKKPRVVIVDSPFVARIAAGASAAIWYLRKNGKINATDAATDDATDAATYAATDAATYAATDDATDAATYAATYAATDDATRAATDDATDAATNKKYWLYDFIKLITPNEIKFTLGVISLSYRFYQGGNMWSSFDSLITAYRDVLGLKIKEHKKYEAWERASKLGGFRFMHEEFCIVSDFPEILVKDEQNRPHNDHGPSHKWRDGFEIYHLDGVRLEKEEWENIMSGKMTFDEILKIELGEKRMVAMKYNPQAIINSGAVLVDKDTRNNELYKIENHQLNELLEHNKIYFLKMTCPTGRVFIEGVDPSFVEINGEDANAAQAELCGLTKSQYYQLEMES